MILERTTEVSTTLPAATNKQKVISQSREVELDRNPIKIIIIGLFGIALSVWTVYSFYKFFTEGNAQHLIWATLSGILFVAITIAHAFLIKSTKLMKLITLLEAFAPIALFYQHIIPEPSVPLLVGGLLLWYMISIGVGRGSRMLANSMRIRFFEIARAVFPRVTTGMILFITVVFYLTFFAWGGMTTETGRTFFSGTLDILQPAVRIWFPQTSFNGTVHEALTGVVESQLNRNTVGSVDEFSLDERATIISKSVATIGESLEKTFGRIDFNAPFVNEIYRVFLGLLQSSSLMSLAIGFGTALVLFFVLRSVTALLSGIILLFGFIFFKILLITNFAHIAVENRSREFVILT